jgi:hypothetical protein
LLEEKNMKCYIYGCENNSEQGNFVGNLCAPCYYYLYENKGKHSQAERNERQIISARKDLQRGDNAKNN